MPANVDVAKLHLQVTSSGIKSSKKELDGLTRTASKTESGLTNVRLSVVKLVRDLAGLIASVAGLNKFVQVNRQFDILDAQLHTITGNAIAARGAFHFISKFAQETPYDLQQVTRAFVTLNNFGLDPSERALKSYGNTASSMGKSLEQMIEAVADATTNEFERLKEFGIKAKSEGDNVIFTFRGVSTTVKKNAQAIENYLIKLGELNFSGAMERRMLTLDGMLSNLGDQFDIFFMRISNLGFGRALEKSLGWTLSIFERLNDFLAVDAIVGLRGFSDQITELSNQLNGFFAPIKNLFVGIYNFITRNHRDILLALKVNFLAFVDAIIEAVKYFPQNLKAMKEIIGAVLKSIFGLMLISFTKFIDDLKLKLSFFFDLIGVMADKVKSILKFDFDFDATNRISALVSTYYAKQKSLERESLQLKNELNSASKKAIGLALIERQSSIDAFEEKQKQREAELKFQRADEEAAFKKFKRQEEDTRQQKQKSKVDRELKENQLSYTADFFGNLATISSQAGRRQSNLSRRLAIVQTTIKTYEAAMSAYASLAGIPLIGPALGAAAAGAAISYGFANIQAIRNAAYYDKGGMIPAGQLGIVGERGPELVRGPANVMSRKETARKIDDLYGDVPRGTKTKPVINVSVLNFFDEKAFRATVASEMAANKEVIINIIQTQQSQRRL